MTATAAPYESLLQDALQLPVEERSRMAARLIDSVDEDDTPMSPAWEAEVNRRIFKIQSGTATLIPHDEAIDSARRRIAEIRQAQVP